jgi:hypothetical protein
MNVRAFVFTTTILLCATFAQAAATTTTGGRLPVFFVANAGQFPSGSDFVLHSDDATAVFRASEVSYIWSRSGRTVRMRFLEGALPRPEGVDELRAKVNYVIGSRADGWISGARTYSVIAYRDEWPGIDAVYSVSEGRLKTEYQLAPGADPNQVRWTYDGADLVEILHDGSLNIHAGDHTLRDSSPQVFEQDRITGALRPVSGAFRKISERTVGISIGPYDRLNRLIFDPVIGFSAVLGGAGQSAATAVAVDSSGNSVVAGYTSSLDLSSTSFSFGVPTRTDAFVAKLSASGKQLLFLTYLGGTVDDRAASVALDKWGNVYIAGTTTSRDFPVVGAVQGQLKGSRDAFVAELNPTGSSLVFSTYLGGGDIDQATGVAVNRLGDIYVTGDTLSTDFPTVRPLQLAKAGGQDAFLTKMSASGAGIIFSSYLGGDMDEHAAGIALSPSGDAAIAGSTLSSNFPIANAWQNHSGGNQDAFVTSIDLSGSKLIFSTYLGGSSGVVGFPEAAAGVAVDSLGNVYIAGTTSSVNFPVSAGAFQNSAGGSTDAFAAKFTASGAMAYSTFLSGSSIDYGNAVAVDGAGNASIVGYTASVDFPSFQGVQNGLRGQYDLFLTKLNPAGSSLVASTLWGGASIDSAAALAVDRMGAAIIGGQTSSLDFPVQGGVQGTRRSSSGSILVRMPIGWKPVVASRKGASLQWTIDSLRNAGVDGNSTYVQTVNFGGSTDVPIMGDWNNTGSTKFGTFNNGQWFLDLNGDGIFGPGDRSFTFGQAGDIPVVGDWDGSGRVKAGIFRNGTWILDLSGHLSGTPTGMADRTFVFGLPGDVPVVGDWMNAGTSRVGVFRSGIWYLDLNGDGFYTNSDLAVAMGTAGDQPLVGDWDGSGRTNLGVFRNGQFLLDYNGNQSLDVTGDMSFSFGSVGQTAFLAK